MRNLEIHVKKPVYFVVLHFENEPQFKMERISPSVRVERRRFWVVSGQQY